MCIKPYDLYLQMSTSLYEISELLYAMQSCMSDGRTLETASMPKLNDNETKLMLVTSKEVRISITNLL